MQHGYYKTAAVVAPVIPANPKKNARLALDYIEKAYGSALAVFPELSLTGLSAGDLLSRDTLLREAENALLAFAHGSRSFDGLIAVGLPVRAGNCLCSVAAVIFKGEVIGAVPARISSSRVFPPLGRIPESIELCGKPVPFGTDIVFRSGDFSAAFTVGGDDLGPCPPCDALALGGAAIIGRLAGGCELAGQSARREMSMRALSGRLSCGYVVSNCGDGESSSFGVPSGYRAVFENGVRLSADGFFSGSASGLTTGDIDLALLRHERVLRRWAGPPVPPTRYVDFALGKRETALTRRYSPDPFIPEGEEARAVRCDEVFALQVSGLRSRLEKIGNPRPVVNFSGGLDSTLALLVSSAASGRALALNLPGPGTTERTRSNAEKICFALGVELRTISIDKALERHLRDIGHGGQPDVTYENAQARLRTMIAMDIANTEGGVMIGTSDLSETALGFCTFGGDHMGMFGVNSSVPKTLIRQIVLNRASRSSAELGAALRDIVDMPVSPELLPVGAQGEQRQHTERILGDYRLHDFFLFWSVRHGFGRDKLKRAADCAFNGLYAEEEVIKTLDTFLIRFSSSQYKRSCSPEGVRTGSVWLGAVGGPVFPSDTLFAL